MSFHFICAPLVIQWGFPDGSLGKQSACNTGDLCSVPGLGISPGKEKGYPLLYSGLENSMDCIVHEELDMTEQLSLYFGDSIHCCVLQNLYLSFWKFIITF